MITNIKPTKLFKEIYSITKDDGLMVIPKDMKPWVKKQFGSVANVEKQRIIRIDNEYSMESALFNELRAKRPIDAKSKVVLEYKEGPFSSPIKMTPADTFGRIKGKHCVTASNVAKYDAVHGLVIFGQTNPWKVTKEELKDYLDTTQKWIKKAAKETNRQYPYVMWNCLWKAAASIMHGHMQIVMGKDKHYAEIEKLRMIAEEYLKETGTDYFEKIYSIHKEQGLAMKYKKAKILVYLTPKKDKEVWIISEAINPDAIYKVYSAYKKMGVQSFNMGIYLSPLDGSWKMPVITRFVDRGKLSNKTTDVGGMEMFTGTNVIETDPYNVMKYL